MDGVKVMLVGNIIVLGTVLSEAALAGPLGRAQLGTPSIVFDIVLALGGVCLLIWALARVVGPKWRARRQSQRPALDVVESVELGQAKIHVIEHCGRTLLVGVTEAGMQVLHEGTPVRRQPRVRKSREAFLSAMGPGGRG